MTPDNAINIFASYSHAEKKEFLAQLMYELTLITRDSYEVGQDGLTNSRRVRRVNEVQHRVSAFLWALLRNDPQRFPDDVFIKIVLEHADDEMLGRQLGEAFARLAAQRLTAV
ncbi:MAG: hypothetical protein H0T60_00710 [Acidobacteria bacterium]|nr:hypothetical protein [Acidobacteriota bacterium]